MIPSHMANSSFQDQSLSPTPPTANSASTN
jgi:hypothetical protein